MIVTHRDQFLNLLAKSNLLPNQALRALIEDHTLTASEDPLEIARLLVKTLGQRFDSARQWHRRRAPRAQGFE